MNDERTVPLDDITVPPTIDALLSLPPDRRERASERVREKEREWMGFLRTTADLHQALRAQGALDMLDLFKTLPQIIELDLKAEEEAERRGEAEHDYD